MDPNIVNLSHINILHQVGPQAIYVVDRDEDDYDSGDEVASWDTFDGVADSPANKKGQVS